MRGWPGRLGSAAMPSPLMKRRSRSSSLAASYSSWLGAFRSRSREDMRRSSSPARKPSIGRPSDRARSSTLVPAFARTRSRPDRASRSSRTGNWAAREGSPRVEAEEAVAQAEGPGQIQHDAALRARDDPAGRHSALPRVVRVDEPGPSPLGYPALGAIAREGEPDRLASRGQLFFVRSFPGQAIYQAPIQRGRRVAVLGGLHPALDLETRDAGRREFPYPVAQVEVLAGKPVGVAAFQPVIGTAELGAIAPVARSSEDEAGGEAEPGERVAEGPVDEGLVFDSGLFLGEALHLGEARLAGQDYPGRAQLARYASGPGALDGGLGRCVYRHFGVAVPDDPG